MNYFELSLYLCGLLVFALPGSTETENQSIREYLINLENSDYDKRIAPDGRDGPGTPVDVNVTMYFLDISMLNEYCMDFDAQFYFRQMWVDTRLQYDLNVSEIIARDVDNIWTPDLFFVNEKEGSQSKIMHPNMFCRIMPNGTVHYSIRLSERLSCSMDLRKYPLDTQICKIKAESYGFTRKHIELNWAPIPIPVSKADNITAINFDLIYVTPTTKYVNVSTGSYSNLEVHLTFKRKMGFFGRRMYAPFVILVLLSWLSLWIKAKERYLRLALLLVILYLMVTIASELDRLIPNTPYTKSSDVWIGFCEASVFAVFLEFILVCIIFRKEPEEANSKANGEIFTSLDPEAKDNNISPGSLKSPFKKIINMIDARRGKQSSESYRIDRISRLMFPVTFVLFNIVYWSVYCSA